MDNSLMYNSVETFAIESTVIFITNTTTIFKKEKEVAPVHSDSELTKECSVKTPINQCVN